jgi:hypothetical protein
MAAGRDPGAHVVAAAWPQERPGLPGTSATVLAPGCAVGGLVASIVMTGVRRASSGSRARFTRGGARPTTPNAPEGCTLLRDQAAVSNSVCPRERLAQSRHRCRRKFQCLIYANTA